MDSGMENIAAGEREEVLVPDYARLEESLRAIVSANGDSVDVPVAVDALARAERLSRNEALAVMWRLVDKDVLRFGSGTVALNPGL